MFLQVGLDRQWPLQWQKLGLTHQCGLYWAVKNGRQICEETLQCVRAKAMAASVTLTVYFEGTANTLRPVTTQVGGCLLD